MEDQSYHKGLATGVSDGTQSGNRGVQENYRRKANVQHEANKLGDNLASGVAALFLHPVFCFVGFWIIGFGSLLALAPKVGLGSSIDDAPTWYAWTAAGVPVVVAIMFRRIIPKLMAVAFYIGIAALVVLMAIKVVDIRKERAARAGSPQAVVLPESSNLSAPEAVIIGPFRPIPPDARSRHTTLQPRQVLG